MTSATKPLSISLSRRESGDLVQLARRSSTTRQALAVQAVRQVLAMARSDAPPAVPLPCPADGPLDGADVTAALNAPEATALDALALRLQTTPAALGRAAVLQMLVASKAGAVPMVKTMAQPDDELNEPASATASKLNFEKARLIVDRLGFIAEWGLNDRSRAALQKLEDELKTYPPF